MKRIYLQKITQHGQVCYIGKIDPRELVKVAVKVEIDETQDAQRPLNKKRVIDIAKYIATEDGAGILPNTLTIATKDTRFGIKKDAETSFYYINFPSEKDEFKDYVDAIDVMDGQHRLYSFQEDICLLHKDDSFEIGFTLYDRPTLNQRRQIFISCNEKQEKVSGNLLMWFRIQLDMVSDEEKNFYSIVQKLSVEYPLKGHIIMSAEKITNGVKAKEIMAAMKQAGIHNMRIKDNPLNEDQRLSVICRYLSAWENLAAFKFSTSKPKEAGPAIKMAGLKFMILLLPTIWNRAIATQSTFNEEYIKDTLSQLATKLGVERDRFFTCEEHKLKFRDRTVTDAFAEECKNIIIGLGNDDFDPLG